MKAAVPDPSTTCAPYDRAAVDERLLAESQAIARVPNFRLDNVAEFYAESDRQLWDVKDDIPNWAPPFRQFFAEWNMPKDWNMGGRVPIPNKGPSQSGVFVVVADVTDDTRNRIADYKLLLSRWMGVQSTADPLGGRVEAALLSARWLYCCTCWLTQFRRPLCGTPYWVGLQNFVFVDPAGKAIDYFAGGLSLNYLIETCGEDSVFSCLHILGLGISFCHCKNVVRTEHEDDQGERWHRRTKTPKVKFYTLNIGPMRQTLRTEGQSDAVGIKRALHICRGHFATYNPESPLFGKYVGTFWRPDHVRGSKEAGEVHKRYNVESDPHA